MQLAVAEVLAAVEVAGAGLDLHRPVVLDDPLGAAPPAVLPGVEVRAVKEDDRVAGCGDRLDRRGPGVDDRRVRAVLVVDLPLLPGELRGIVVADALSHGGVVGRSEGAEGEECGRSHGGSPWGAKRDRRAPGVRGVRPSREV